MRDRTSDYGVARICKGINLRGREAYATVPNMGVVQHVDSRLRLSCIIALIPILSP